LITDDKCTRWLSRGHVQGVTGVLIILKGVLSPAY